MSTYYTISSAEDIDAQIYDTFILADGSDDRTLEQLVARRAHNPEAAGSSPVPATMFNR